MRRNYFTKKIWRWMTIETIITRNIDEPWKMSNQQCYVWGCHNRKGRCVEDVSGNWLCGCRKQHFDSCPRPELLTLHTISKMPVPIKRAVIQRINFTRQGPEQSRWKASTEAVICNVHYVDFVGQTKTLFLRILRTLIPLLIHQLQRKAE